MSWMRSRTGCPAAWLLILLPAAALPAAEPAPPKADGDKPVGGAPAPDDKPIPGKPPAPGETPKEPASIAPPAPPPERKRAFIHALEPGSRLKSGPDRSVVARGKIQMVIPDDEVIVYCTALDYSGEATGIATVTGDLRIETGKIVDKDGKSTIPNPENVLTGDIAYVFTKEKRAVVDGHVVVVHQPQEAAKEGGDEVEQAKHEKTTLTCDRLTYWYRKGDRKAVAQPLDPNQVIHFEQKTRKGTAGKATFYDFAKDQSETGDVLDLTGGVQAEDDKGQRLQAEVLRIYVDKEMLDGYNFSELVINLEEEEKNPNEPGKPPAVPGGEAAPAPAPPPPAAPSPPAGPPAGGTG
ncbi:MAG: hypothetical protein HYU66_15735 [Armatimonadetes bacterium]|nr:hypothetical protein [Armatimonadota bacterium]